MSWLKTLQNGWHFIVNESEKEALVFYHAVISSAEANGGKLLRDAATAAVSAAEVTGGSGQDKFNAALASVVSTLSTAGIPIVKNAVNGAIEAAVANLKNPA